MIQQAVRQVERTANRMGGAWCRIIGALDLVGELLAVSVGVCRRGILCLSLPPVSCYLP